MNPEYSLEGCWIHWCWNGSSNTLATWCKEPLRKSPNAGKDWGQEEKGMTEEETVIWTHVQTQWTWVWVSSRRRWRTGKPGVLQSMGSKRAEHDWAIEQQQPSIPTEPMTTSTILENYTELKKKSKTSHTAWFHFYNIFEMMNDKTTEMENRFTLSGLQGCGAGVGGRRGSYKRQWGGPCCGRTLCPLMVYQYPDCDTGDSKSITPGRAWRKGTAVSLCHFSHLLWTYDYVKAKILTLF